MVGLTFIFDPITNRVSVGFRLRNTLIINSFIISFKPGVYNYIELMFYDKL